MNSVCALVFFVFLHSITFLKQILSRSIANLFFRMTSICPCMHDLPPTILSCQPTIVVWPQNTWTRFWVRNTSPTYKEVAIFTANSILAPNCDDNNELIRCQNVCYTTNICNMKLCLQYIYNLFFKFQHLFTNKNFREWRPGAGKIQRYSLCLVCESDIGDLRWQTRPQFCLRTYFASNISKEIFVNQVASFFQG